MPEFWLNIDPVGFHKVFLTGRVPGNEQFETELTVQQMADLDEFQFRQQQELQAFLMDLIKHEN